MIKFIPGKGSVGATDENGPPVNKIKAAAAPVNRPSAVNKDRAEYMREYMRAKRAKERTGK